MLFRSEVNAFGPSFGLDISTLKLDEQYDMSSLGEQHGRVIFYAEDEDVSTRRAAEMILALERALTSKDVDFYAIDFVLEKPRVEGAVKQDDQAVRVQSFLHDDILKPDLEARVQAAHDELTAYYAVLDGDKTR